MNKQNEFVVLSILGREGPVHESFEFIESFMPLPNGTQKSIDEPFNLNTLLPKDKSKRYEYTGSLTTPPCTEGVNWIIYKEPLVLSVKQVQELKDIMPNDNYRNVQALNGRTVYKTFEQQPN